MELAKVRGWKRVLTERVIGIHLYADTESLEIILSTIAIGWGVTFLLPYDSFHTGVDGGAVPSYRIMSDWFGHSETLFGAVFFILGMLQLICLVLDVYRGRKYCAMIGIFVWSVVCIAFLLADPRLPNFVTYAPLTIGSAFVYLRLKEL